MNTPKNFTLIVVAAIALVILVVASLYFDPTNRAVNTEVNTGCTYGGGCSTIEGFSLATAETLQRFGYQSPPIQGYRIKARAYHSCDLPEDCPAHVAEIPKSSYVISNPFVWPFSGSATPHEIAAKAMPSGTTWQVPSDVIYEGEGELKQEYDHQELNL